MSIHVTEENLTADPQQIQLPGNVTLHQTVVSTEPSEVAVMEYSMSPAHNVWFELASGTRSKTVTFQETVPSTGMETSHPIRLVRFAGAPSGGSVGIDQRVTDASGGHTLDHTFVLLT